MRNLAIGLVILITAAGVAWARKKPAPPPNQVIASKKALEESGHAYPYAIEWDEEMLVVVPGTGAQYFSVDKPASSDRASVRYSLNVRDPATPPCCGTPMCYERWQEWQKENPNPTFGPGLLKIKRTTKKVYVTVAFFKDTTPCRAP